MASRRSQAVSTKSQRKQVMEWVVEEVERAGNVKNIASKAVARFPNIFKLNDNKSSVACKKKAYRWYIMHQSHLHALKTDENKAMYIRSRSLSGVSEKRYNLKALEGRGKRRSDRVEYLHSILIFEFERLSNAGVKLCRNLMRDAALNLMSHESSPFTLDQVHENAEKPIHDLITQKFVDAFLNRFNIVVQSTK